MRTHVFLTGVLLSFLCACPGTAWTVEALLGSMDFKPTPERPVGWRGDGTGRFLGATPPVTWERKLAGNAYVTHNIKWMTHMPACSIASPIVVGDRVFVCSDFSDLLCCEKKSGRILWAQPNGYYEAARDAEREDPGFKAKMVPLAEDIRKLRERLIEQSNALIGPNGMTPARRKLTLRLRSRSAIRKSNYSMPCGCWTPSATLASRTNSTAAPVPERPARMASSSTLLFWEPFIRARCP